jgi:hypothetical protein
MGIPSRHLTSKHPGEEAQDSRPLFEVHLFQPADNVFDAMAGLTLGLIDQEGLLLEDRGLDRRIVVDVAEIIHLEVEELGGDVNHPLADPFPLCDAIHPVHDQVSDPGPCSLSLWR